MGRRSPLRARACLGLFALSVTLAAQDPPAFPQRIRAELERVGSLEDLREEWRDAPVEQRVALELEDGELRAALALLEGRPRLRADLFDALGDISGALAAVQEILVEDGLAPAERAGWLRHRGELLAAAGDRAGAERSLRQSAELAPERAFALGALAGTMGLHDLALELHDPAAGSDNALSEYLRRGLWQERREDADAATREYRAAHRSATRSLDKRFALTRMVEVHRRAGSLDELVRQWLDQPRLESSQRRALLGVLRELSRGAEALEFLAELDPRDPDAFALQRQAMDIALEGGETAAALEFGGERLRVDPGDLGIRVSVAWLFMDLFRDDDAAAILNGAIPYADEAGLAVVVRSASELQLQAVVTRALAALASSGEQQRLAAVLLEVEHLRRHRRGEEAAHLLTEAAQEFSRPADRVRLGESLESGGNVDRALDLYREVYDETHSEDLGMRLAWLLSDGDQGQRQEAQEIFRDIWLNAGSAGRRAQAEERVLSLAAAEGTLADLALELEDALEDPDTNRDAVRDALVRIYTRALDTFGATEVLMAYAREPGHEVDAWRDLARMHLLAEEYRKHERALRRLLELDPTAELEYLQQLALSALERGRPALAREVSAELLERRPTVEAFEFAAGIHALASRDRETVRIHRRFLASYPDRIEIRLSLGQALDRDGRRDQAIGMLCAILLRDPPDDLFLVAVDGLLNLDAGPRSLGFAARRVRRRLAEHPQTVYLHRALQDLLQTLGDSSYLASLEETLAVAGEQRITWLRELMDLAADRGDAEDFLRHGRAVLESEAELPPRVFVALGDAWLQSGELRTAERAFARARFSIDSSAVEERVANLYGETGRWADAERLRRRILRRAPQDPNALLPVAQLLEQRGQTEDALSLYRRAVARMPLPLRGAGSAALTGALRTATSSTDLDDVRARLRSRLLENPPPPAAVFTTLLNDLRRTVELWDEFVPTLLGPVEDRLLATAGTSQGLRSEILWARVLRGDLAGARAAVRGHDSEHAAELAEVSLLEDLSPASRPPSLRPIAEQPSLADPETRLRAALDANRDRPRQRVEAVVRALANHRDLPVGEKAEVLDTLTVDALVDRTGYSAQVLLDAGRDLLSVEGRTRLGRLALDSIRQVHLLPTRARFLSILPATEATAMLDNVVNRFPPSQRNPHLLRILNDRSVSVELQELVVRKLVLAPGTPGDLYWLARLCTVVKLNPTVAAALHEALEEEPTRNAYARLLAASLEPDRRETHLVSALQSLRTQPLDANAIQLLEAVVPFMGPGGVDPEELGDEAVDHFLRGALLQESAPAEAGVELRAAVAAHPENLVLLQAVQARLGAMDQWEVAAELYATYMATRPRIEPDKAATLAGLYLNAEQPARALQALSATRDPDQQNRGLALAAIIALEDLDQRSVELRRWARTPHRAGSASTRRLTPARHRVETSLEPVTVTTPAPPDPGEALARGHELDLLGFVPEGMAIADALRRTMDVEAREAATDLYRGWLKSAQLRGEHAALVEMARRRLQRNPHDGEAWRILFAAVQLGWDLTEQERAWALGRKAILDGNDTTRTLEVLATAHHAGEVMLARALLRKLTSTRGRLAGLAAREQVGGILSLVRQQEADQLLRLMPGADVNVDLDGALMTALVDHPDLDRLLQGFSAVPVFLEQRRSLFAGMRLALPWTGLSLRAGNLAAARRALTLEDPSVEIRDDFPAQALAAAVPELALWRDPDLAVPWGTFLKEQAQIGSFGRRLLFQRLGELLARRLEDAGRQADADALRQTRRR